MELFFVTLASLLARCGLYRWWWWVDYGARLVCSVSQRAPATLFGTNKSASIWGTGLPRCNTAAGAIALACVTGSGGRLLGHLPGRGW